MKKTLNFIKSVFLNIEQKIIERQKSQEILNKKRKLLMAGLSAFNNGSTCLAGNRVKGDKERVNIDHTSFYK